MIKFNYFNLFVLDLEQSVTFYKEALGLEFVRRNEQDDSIQVYLGEKDTGLCLRLTWLKGRIEPYVVEECESYLSFQTDEFDSLYKKHQAMGCVCFENLTKGFYYIADPDGYWIKIVPEH